VIQRLESPIIGLKNFNNWVKSVLITRFAHPVLTKSKTRAVNGSDGFKGGRRGREDDIGVGKVLDMGCGKGGDMTKWAKAKVREFFGVGMASLGMLPPLNLYLFCPSYRYRGNISGPSSVKMGVSSWAKIFCNVCRVGLLYPASDSGI
jgi:hypothetical protein